MCSVKGNVNKMKRQATEWEKIFAVAHLIKGRSFKVYRELFKLKSKKTTQFFKWEKDLNIYLTREEIWMAKGK